MDGILCFYALTGRWPLRRLGDFACADLQRWGLSRAVPVEARATIVVCSYQYSKKPGGLHASAPRGYGWNPGAREFDHRTKQWLSAVERQPNPTGRHDCVNGYAYSRSPHQLFDRFIAA